MNASELYKAGRLKDAIDAQVQEVKANPADHARRVFLFELLCFAGELDRARRQIDAIQFDESERDMAALSYRKLVDAEEGRRKLFAEGVAPEILGEEHEHIKLRLEAAGHLRLGRNADAVKLIAEADAVTPAFHGKFNGKPFETLRDADDLFSGVLEVMAQGKYFWVGLEQIVSIAMNPPRFPRDLLYAPARLELEQETGEVFLPALYPSSYAHADDQIRLGRMTDWTETDGGPVLGVGARVFLLDDDAVSLLDWREIVRDEPVEPEPAAEG
jgi:type VI secretion system protein ImpE